MPAPLIFGVHAVCKTQLDGDFEPSTNRGIVCRAGEILVVSGDDAMQNVLVARNWVLRGNIALPRWGNGGIGGL